MYYNSFHQDGASKADNERDCKMFDPIMDLTDQKNNLLLANAKLETELTYLKRHYLGKLELAKRALNCIATEAGDNTDISIIAWMTIDNLNAEDCVEI